MAHRFHGTVAATGLFLAAGAAPAGAQHNTLESLGREMDFVWMLVAASLVLLMQTGFLLLEAGMVRSKNSINVAQKNLLDMAFAIVAFALVGFMLAFAPNHGMPFGADLSFAGLGALDSWQMGFFVFQVMFCGTAATIVSGAVAERMRLFSYVLCSVVVSALIYPVFVNWCWGGALAPSGSAFLGNMGFVDFAGSTVVHSTGGWVALAACLVMGPRLGRFDAEGRPIRIAGHNPVLAAAGTLLLFVGWIGFNGGSTTSATPQIAQIIANTVLAAGAGGVSGYLLGWMRDRVVYPEKSLSGMLGGLVAVTAGCAVLDAGGALLTGTLGGIVALWGNAVVEEELRVDDAVGAIGVHAFAGVAGTLSLALLAPVANLPAGARLAQLEIQATGVVANFGWAFGVGFAFFWLLNRLSAIRVTAEEEILGLNEAEHGTRMGVGHVEQALQNLVAGDADLSMRLQPVEGDESEALTRLFNRLMDNIEAEEIARGKAAMDMRDAEEAERLSALASATFEAIWILQDGHIVDGNHKLEELVGEPLSALRGRLAVELLPPEHRPALLAAMELAVAAPYEAEITDRTGTAIPVEMRGRDITFRGGRAHVGCLVDLRARRDAEERIRHLALHDPLTGLPNRALFNERLEHLVKLKEEAHGLRAVLLVDLDRFKDVNDVYGHPAGDRVIRVTAERLSALAGSDVTIARLGGDEFALLMSGLAFANQAADLAFRVVSQLSMPITLESGAVVRVGASVGVSICPRDGNEPARLISRADTALYNAKNMGRNTYCLFEAGMDALMEMRRQLESDLAQALDRGEFELYFQPRVSIGTRRVEIYEALIRWRHPERGLVSPSDFIPVAEETGQIIAIGEWVLKTTCRLMRGPLAGMRVSVNVSPVQFRQKDFVDIVAAALDEAGVEPWRLEIEVTEGVLIDDDKRAERILRQLKKRGLSLALDDFGTGYASLGYLSRFPFDTIKIDRTFVSEITVSENARAIVASIVGLGNGLRMRVVAEGVEALEQAAMLCQIGCHELQGFLLGHPTPVERLDKLSPERIADIADTARRLGNATAAQAPTPDERLAATGLPARMRLAL
ncbi:MAG TPA: ammonium transporter [Rhizobiales bacterium]|nr:ammonium transporter [Hyphomicrobiales bacterium]